MPRTLWRRCGGDPVSIQLGRRMLRRRATHPWARPDGHHWLMLRWLAQKTAP